LQNIQYDQGLGFGPNGGGQHDALSVLYEDDEQYFGQNFGNPLRDAWWNNDFDNEDFLGRSAVGAGMTALDLPASSRGSSVVADEHRASPTPKDGEKDLFDAEAMDPATGRYVHVCVRVLHSKGTPRPLPL
jgi:hypothetical protein